MQTSQWQVHAVNMGIIYIQTHMHNAVQYRGHEALAQACLCLRQDYSWSLLSLRNGDQSSPFRGLKTSRLTSYYNKGLACKQNLVGLDVMPSHIRTPVCTPKEPYKEPYYTQKRPTEMGIPALDLDLRACGR